MRNSGSNCACRIREIADLGALWLSYDPCAVEPGGLEGRQRSGLSAYKEEGLGLRKRAAGRRHAMVHRQERFKATGPNQVWAMDLVSDQLCDGRRFRSLTVVDIYTRESLAIESGQSLRGEDVVRVLQQVGSEWKIQWPKLRPSVLIATALNVAIRTAKGSDIRSFG